MNLKSFFLMATLASMTSFIQAEETTPSAIEETTTTEIANDESFPEIKPCDACKNRTEYQKANN